MFTATMLPQLQQQELKQSDDASHRYTTNDFTWNQVHKRYYAETYNIISANRIGWLKTGSPSTLHFFKTVSGAQNLAQHEESDPYALTSAQVRTGV